MVETSPGESLAMHNGGARFGDSTSHRGGTNAIYYMGEVRHHLTASLDWKQLRPIGMEVSLVDNVCVLFGIVHLCIIKLSETEAQYFTLEIL